MAGMRKPLPVAWAVFDGIDRMHIAKGYSEAESCAEDIGGEIVPLYRAPRWIPVSERLPDIGVSVLCSSKEPPGEDLVWIGQREQYDWYFPGANEMGEPTHWMPLPEPPEVK
jgi:hypothetical protein